MIIVQRKLLGNSPEVTNENEEIPPFCKIAYKRRHTLYTLHFKQAKISITCGKSDGVDGIIPEVLKYFPMYDIVLKSII